MATVGVQVDLAASQILQVINAEDGGEGWGEEGEEGEEALEEGDGEVKTE